MIPPKSFSRMRKDFEKQDVLRENTIKKSRDITRLSKKAIYSLHRGDIKKADAQLKKARSLIKSLKKLISGEDVQTGAFSSSLEEYVEASCYYAFMKGEKLPDAYDLGVSVSEFLGGLCDFAGELVRKAINSSIAGDYVIVPKIRDLSSNIYSELLMFDFRGSPLRRKFDSVKYSLEKLEDLYLELKLNNKL